MLDAGSLQNLGHDVFHHGDDVFLIDKAHLNVDLGELRLAIGTQVLVAETTGNLIITLDTAAHEHLLELLRALRKRVELTGIRAAGNQIVAGTLGGGVGKDRGLDLDEPALVERPADSLRNHMTQFQSLVHLRTTKVEVAPFHACGFVGFDAVLDGEGRRDRSVKNGKRGGQNLDFASGHVGVHHTLAASTHGTNDLKDELTAKMLGCLEVAGINAIGIDDDLGIALAIAQVDENQAAVITIMPSPSAQSNLRAHVFPAKLAAGVGMHTVLVDKVSHRFLILLVRRRSMRHRCFINCNFLIIRPRFCLARRREALSRKLE